MELHVLSKKIGYATNSSSYHNMIVWDGEKYERFKSGEYMMNEEDDLGLVVERDGEKYINFGGSKQHEVFENPGYSEDEAFSIEGNCKYYYMFQPSYANREYKYGLMDFYQWDEQQCERYEVDDRTHITPSGDKVYIRFAFGYDY